MALINPTQPTCVRSSSCSPRRAYLVLGDVLAVLSLRLVREDTGSAAARSRVRLRRRAAASRPDQEPAVGAAHGLRWPLARHLLLDEQEAVRAVGVVLGLGACS